MKKLFIVKKYIYAENAKEAITEDKTHEVDDVFVDKDWQIENMCKSVGFNKADD